MTRKNPHAVALGRLGGRVSTPKKRAHLTALAARGVTGRKPKFAIGDRVLVRATAPAVHRGQIGTVRGHGARARYEVTLGDRTVRLYSWWLDRVSGRTP